MDILLWEELPVDAKEAGAQGLKPEEEIARFTVSPAHNSRQAVKHG